MVKIRQLVSLSMLILLVQVAIWVPAKSFPGFSGNSDSTLCHNEPANAYYNNTFAGPITLDGNVTESYWGDYNTVGRRMEIPVANVSGGGSRPEEFVKVVFAQNATHLFMLIEWTDASINGSGMPYGIADGFAICFNINATDFNAYYVSGMKTPAAGEAVDTYVWQAAANLSVVGLYPAPATVQTVPGVVMNYHYDSNGWVPDSTNNYQAAAVHGNTSRSESYRLEIVRPLVDNVPGDVQFNEDRYYDFTIAIFNATSGVNHMVSYNHQVWVKAPGTGGIGLPGTIITLSFFAALGIIAIVLVYKRKNRVSIE